MLVDGIVEAITCIGPTTTGGCTGPAGTTPSSIFRIGVDGNAAPLQPSRPAVVGQFAVAALSEHREPLRIQERRSETAATEFKLGHYPASKQLDLPEPWG